MASSARNSDGKAHHDLVCFDDENHSSTPQPAGRTLSVSWEGQNFDVQLSTSGAYIAQPGKAWKNLQIVSELHIFLQNSVATLWSRALRRVTPVFPLQLWSSTGRSKAPSSGCVISIHPAHGTGCQPAVQCNTLEKTWVCGDIEPVEMSPVWHMWM